MAIISGTDEYGREYLEERTPVYEVVKETDESGRVVWIDKRAGTIFGFRMIIDHALPVDTMVAVQPRTPNNRPWYQRDTKGQPRRF